MYKLKSKSFAVFSIILLTALVLIITLSFIPQDSQATKLVLVASTTFIPLDKPVKLTIKAIDDAGKVDTTRNDIVELNLTSVSYDKPSAKLTTKKIQLIEGVGSVHIQGEVPEVVDITVQWKEGKSPLESSKLHLFMGIGEE
ncbi:hypothetical protein [[Eubacterium] cellulosolvens]